MIRNIVLLICSVSLLFASLFEAEPEQIKAKVLYAKYQSYPQIVYTKQRFKVKIETNILLPDEQFFRLETKLQKHPNLELLTEDIVWYKGKKNFYETTLEFKVKEKRFTFPKISITLSDDEDMELDKVYLEPPEIIYRKIAINQERYSNIIAKDLYIKSVKTRQYTNNKLLSIVELEGVGGNLEDFYLESFENQGIKHIKEEEGKQNLLFFVIIPSHLDTIIFDYYNILNDEFVTVEVPIILKEELVSTQTELNPYESSFEFYKKIFLMVLVSIFLMIYFFKRRGKYLLIAIMLMTILIIMMQPNEKITLQKNEKVYILPTANSTVFKIVEHAEEVEVLNTKDDFTKVLFQNKNIGWVKNESN
jgi:hypothetical protein